MLTGATNLLKTAVSALSTAEGADGAARVTGNILGLLGGSMSDESQMLLKYGYLALGSVLSGWSKPEITDDEVKAELEKRLGKEPFKLDLAKLWTGGV